MLYVYEDMTFDDELLGQNVTASNLAKGEQWMLS